MSLVLEQADSVICCWFLCFRPVQYLGVAPGRDGRCVSGLEAGLLHVRHVTSLKNYLLISIITKLDTHLGGGVLGKVFCSLKNQ